ncbi:MAG: DUF3667 domain-containing protein [bacterium]|nr:DUF3667 domain-containing protein [bacterium]
MDDPSASSSEETSNAIRRLTLRLILRDLAERFFSLERGWLRTARELCTGPGGMIRRYIAGDRRSYANPFAYLLVGSAISILFQKAMGIGEFYLQGVVANPDLTTRQVAFARDMQELLLQYMLYVSLGILIPFAALLRLFFRRSGYNIAEMTVFALYTGGHLALLGAAAFPLIKALAIHPAFVGAPLALFYISYASIGFFEGRVATVVKSCIAYALGTFTYVTVVLAVMLIYVQFFLSDSYTRLDDWNLVSASEQGHGAVVESLIKDGHDVNFTLQRTPLHVAAENGHLEIVDRLLNSGANVNAKDHLGRSPMFYALRADHLEVAWRIAKSDADPTNTTTEGTTLLMLAAQSEDVDLTRWLLEGGSDVNAVRAEGDRITALMYAVTQDDTAMASLLLKHGADPSVTNSEGQSAIDMADSEAIEILLREAVTN